MNNVKNKVWRRTHYIKIILDNSPHYRVNAFEEHIMDIAQSSNGLFTDPGNLLLLGPPLDLLMEIEQGLRSPYSGYNI